METVRPTTATMRLQPTIPTCKCLFFFSHYIPMVAQHTTTHAHAWQISVGRCMHEEESEGDIHCHGFAWSNDPNEASSIFKFNTFFYVSFYDHLYKRGYVENSLGGTHSSTGFPMCGCIEEMPLGKWRPRRSNLRISRPLEQHC
jgi:hypothetical protein